LKANVTHYTCKQAYGLLDDFVLHGLARVDWDALIAELEAPDAVVQMPPVATSIEG
jgi:hypothetical protein